LERLDAEVASRARAAILALPRGESARVGPELVEAGMRVVDVGGDFRLPADHYPRWYGFEHPAEAWLGKAVYGLTELFAEEVTGADLVANPGCYATAVLLALAPVTGLLDDPIVVDGKSGLSGAGATPTESTHFPRSEGSVRAYRIGEHQHTPEIDLVLGRIGGRRRGVTFVPHLVPMSRGLSVTCYAPSEAGEEDLRSSLEQAYREAPFVRVLPPGVSADPKRVAGSNVCEIGVAVDAGTGTAVITGAIDNLLKGAAGQAVQNLNVMFGLDQSAGLPRTAVFP
jgi:N-acetyl-gamma-glutamyl-phosphate reductase